MPMSFDLVKFSRGTVWFIKGGADKAVGHEQGKDRPWLVVSNRKFNESASMITAVPLTSRSQAVSPVHVCFTNSHQVKNVVLCEQIRTFDTSYPGYSFEFYGVMDDDVMHRVDEALSIQLGLPHSSTSLEQLFNSIDSFVTRIVNSKIAAMGAKFSDDDVLSFTEKLQTVTEEAVQDLVNISKSSQYKQSENNSDSQKELDNVSKLDTNNTMQSDLSSSTSEQSKPTQSEEETPTKKRLSWNKELAQKFINDANTYPMKEVMEKWGISKKPRFYSMKKYAEDHLKKTT